ncbi:MAG: terpene cyclase/mutase family protein [Rubripirellula sp.]|nr:terpene cyclase/mutase family protein [Rubripirellula sp.]
MNPNPNTFARSSRRHWLLGLAAATAGHASRAQDPQLLRESAASLYLPDDIDRAVRSGVEYLVQVQRDNGSISDRGHDVAMTSLAIMAMASIGVEPQTYSATSRSMVKAVDFVLDKKHQDTQGYLGGRDGSRMYGHGITTLMLTEILGMGSSVEQNERIHEMLVNAIKLILSAQEVTKSEKLQGGWRYTPTSRDSDLSVSVWQLMALRSAKNDGLNVPGEAIDAALQYLRFSYASPMNRDGTPRDKVTGFSYTPGTHHPSFTMSAAGLLAMQVCGKYDSPMVKGASEWLLQHPPKPNERFFFYGLYYYAQGMHQAGGKYAERADDLVPKLLLESQRSDGAWLARGGEERNVGTVYSTALAILCLSVRYHYLPIYQR